MLELLRQTWEWYVAGPLLALVMILMLHFGKRFGISKSFELACSLGGAGQWISYFKFDWKKYDWLIVFVVGAIGGGYVANRFLMPADHTIALSIETVDSLHKFGITDPGKAYIPLEIFNWGNILSIQGFIMMVIGGFLVGFGTRYAGGCTSGHSISGISELQIPSMIATAGFFIGGLISTNFLIPILLSM